MEQEREPESLAAGNDASERPLTMRVRLKRRSAAASRGWPLFAVTSALVNWTWHLPEREKRIAFW